MNAINKTYIEKKLRFKEQKIRIALEWVTMKFFALVNHRFTENHNINPYYESIKKKTDEVLYY